MAHYGPKFILMSDYPFANYRKCTMLMKADHDS